MTGSAAEPLPQHAAEQMRAATERLRDRAWMVSPLTTTPLQVVRDDESEATSDVEG